jgi:hypothetical protein
LLIELDFLYSCNEFSKQQQNGDIEMTKISLGNVGSEAQALKIKSALNGKTYYKFIVSYSHYAGNYPVLISTEYRYGDDGTEVTEDELKDAVLYCLAMAL